jgi:hypothetical protein
LIVTIGLELKVCEYTRRPDSLGSDDAPPERISKHNAAPGGLQATTPTCLAMLVIPFATR